MLGQRLPLAALALFSMDLKASLVISSSTPGLAGVDASTIWLMQQAFVVQGIGELPRAARPGNRLRLCLPEHLFPRRSVGNAGEAAAGEFGEAIEVQQLAGKQYQRTGRRHQAAQPELCARVQTVVVQDFLVGNAHFAQQQPNGIDGACGQRVRGQLRSWSVSVLKQLAGV